jgi:hypothetical protein
MKRLRKRSLSWAMVFCMVMSLFGSGVSDSTYAKAGTTTGTTEAKIVTGDKKVANGSFTYPDLTVKLSSDTEVIHRLSISVDSGYIRAASVSITDKENTAQVGEGVLYGNGYSENSDFQTLKDSTDLKYEALQFNSDAGFTASAVQTYLRTLLFSTEKVNTSGQTIKITATTLSDDDMVLKVSDNTTIKLHYFNGHYYGYVPSSAYNTYGLTWDKAYKESSKLKFRGVQGYLMTITTRAEDRFVYSNFQQYTDHALEGWMGCTRETLENIESDNIGTNLPKMTSHNDSNFQWRWVTGPEKGEVFGQQTYAYGTTWDSETNTSTDWADNDTLYYYTDSSGNTKSTYSKDGGFETADGYFSNWGTWTVQDPHVEPNGGAAQDEAFGFYGKYTYGRWNDYDITSPVSGYYIEFGGNVGDDDTFAENMNTITIEVKDVVDETINPDSDLLTISGTPVITVSKNGNTAGSYLYMGYGTAGVEGVACGSEQWDDDKYKTEEAFKKNLTTQWYTVDPDTGAMTEIENGGKSSLELTDEILGKQICVTLTGTKYYTGTIVSKPYDATEDVKEPAALTGHPVIKSDDDVAVEGTKLTADVSSMGPDDTAVDNLSYQWYVKDKDSNEWIEIEDANSPFYYLTEDDLGKQIKVTVYADEDLGYTGEADSNWFTVPEKTEATDTETPTPTPAAKTISGKPVIVNDTNVNEVGTVLTADTSNVKGSDGATDLELTYQWYVKDENGTLTPIEGATGSTYTLTEDTLDKDLVVGVTGTGDYTGTRNSNPYTAAQTKIDIEGKPKIVNETIGKDGNEIVRQGTILFANVDDVDPEGSHDTLTYQWYVDKGDGPVLIEGATEPRYTISSDDFYTGEGDDKESVTPVYTVEVTGNGKYQGTLQSDPVTEERTDSDVTMKDDESDSTKRIIVLTPTQDNTIYGIKTADGTVVNPPCVNSEGDPVSPNYSDDTYQNYYLVNAGETLYFTVDKDKEYIISEIHQEKVSYLVVSPDVDTDTISSVDYDDNGTKGDNTDDTISITVDPTDPDYRYAILQKVDGKYEAVTVTYNDVTGTYESDPDSSEIYSDGGDRIVTFSGLPAEGTYKVVAIKNGTTPKDIIGMDVDSSQILGGSSDVSFEAIPIDLTADKDTSSDQNTQTPSGDLGTQTAAPASDAGVSKNTYNLTQEEEDQVTKFIKEHVTDPYGNIVVEISDLTKDIVLSGETEWNNLTDAQKEVVNQRLQEAGCPYTYQQLLEMAKAYKIPGFKLHKVMKVKTKAKLTLMKCKGATIIVTSSNKKVATVNKKGIIKAKKKGKARLTITAVKGKYSNRLVVNIEVRKKFKNATELKNFKSKVIKTPTILIAKKRKLKKSTKIKIYGLEKDAKVSYKSYNKKALPINKKGKYTAKKKGRSLMRVTVKQNDKVYYLYLYVTAFKKGGKKK